MNRCVFKFSTLLLLCWLMPFAGIAQVSDKPSAREQLSLNKGWRFYQGDIPFPEIIGHQNSYNNAKAGKAWGAAAPDFDDTQWRIVNLPHDWAVEGPFDEKANISQGYRHRGIGWYRRNFKVDPADRGKHIELQFDGVSTHCTVWFNGTVVHRNWCGYTSFYIDITSMLRYGDDLNNIVVRVDANAQEGWWYEGAGLYRHAWLVKRSPAHIITDGVYAHPVRKSDGQWEIPAEVTVENSGKEDASLAIEMTLRDNAGKAIATANANIMLKPLDQKAANLSMSVTNPQLWSVDQPTLYTVQTTVKQNNGIVDEVVTQCGFRTIRFTADSGFYLNDKRLKIQGVCNHQDAAGVGVAVPDAIWEFKIRKMKEMGVNAWRCAHNPPSKEFLDLCDRMGMMVMDENRNFNNSPEYIRQLQWMVRRDRNHPSIILWSVFNEEPMQGTEIGYEMVRRMAAEVKKLDATRPITAAMNGGQFTSLNVSKAVDVVGFNYRLQDYDRFHKENPTVPMTSSEDVSGLIVRGEYVTNKEKHILDSYDTQAPGWGNLHRVYFKTIAERPFIAGNFVWTGFDYRGEPTPYIWPTVSSNFGIMDMCGFPKSVYYYYQSQYIKTKPILYVFPHWNWPKDSIGKNIKVMAFTNAESVKLLLNGKVISEKSVEKYDGVTWTVPYQPGQLEAVGYVKGKETSRFKVETTGQPVSLELIPDRSALEGDGYDAMPVTVRALDAKGRPVPTANIPVEFEINNQGNILGHNNGDPNSHEPEKGNKRSLFNGLAQVTIQTVEGSSAPIVLTAKSQGLKPATVSVAVNVKPSVPFVPMAPSFLVISGWRFSPITETMPDPNQEISDNDMNSWSPVRSGQLQKFAEGRFAVYRSKFKPYAGMLKSGAVLKFQSVSGKAQVYVNNKLIYTRTTSDPGDFEVAYSPDDQEQTISVLIEAERGANGGLGGVVKAWVNE